MLQVLQACSQRVCLCSSTIVAAALGLQTVPSKYIIIDHVRPAVVVKACTEKI
jgi:hypothetical protein